MSLAMLTPFSVDEIDGTWVTVAKNEESGNLV
jgi:hypothetical protein